MSKFHEVRIGPISLARVPSWDWPGVRRKYGRTGAWENDGVITFRWRDLLLHLWFRHDR